MIGRAVGIAALVGCATFGDVPPTHADSITVSTELLQQASIITPEGIIVDPNNKEELKKYDNRHDLSELADKLQKEFGDDLKVVLVTTQKRQEVEKFYAKRPEFKALG